jgi:hypothetical protein
MKIFRTKNSFFWNMLIQPLVCKHLFLKNVLMWITQFVCIHCSINLWINIFQNTRVYHVYCRFVIIQFSRSLRSSFNHSYIHKNLILHHLFSISYWNSTWGITNNSAPCFWGFLCKICDIHTQTLLSWFPWLLS